MKSLNTSRSLSNNATVRKVAQSLGYSSPKEMKEAGTQEIKKALELFKVGVIPSF